MTDRNTHDSELRPSYRTLNEPTRLLGLSLAAWAGVIGAGGGGYAFLAVSPLPWRVNFSVIVIGLGGPVLLLILREPGTIGPGRLLAAVTVWRLRPTLVVAPDEQRTVRRGAVRLDAPVELVDDVEAADDLPWTAEAGR